MEKSLSYYQILGLSPSATTEDVKRAYRNQARRYHPDLIEKLPPEEKALGITFQDINEAYRVLSDDEIRKEYDQFLGLTGAPVESTAEGSENKKAADDPEQDPNIARARRSPIFEELDTEEERPATKKAENKDSARNEESEKGSQHFSGQSTFADRFKKIFSRNAAPEEGNGKDKDIPQPARNSTPHFLRTPEYELHRGERVYSFSINTLESIFGTTRKLAISTEPEPVICDVAIPPGVLDKELVSIELPQPLKKGPSSARARVHIEPHPDVERSGLTITLKLPISLAEALKGAQLALPGLRGPVSVTMKAPWHEKMRLVVQGEGIHRKNSAGELKRGDLVVIPYIVGPDPDSFTPTEEIIEACRLLERCYPQPVRARFTHLLKDLLTPLPPPVAAGAGPEQGPKSGSGQEPENPEPAQ